MIKVFFYRRRKSDGKALSISHQRIELTEEDILEAAKMKFESKYSYSMDEEIEYEPEIESINISV